MRKLNVIPKPNKLSFRDGVFNLPENGEDETYIVKKFDANLENEEYSLCINEYGVTMRALNEQGLFYAKQTLKQIINQYGKSLPYVSILDKPRYAYRGFMVDCARHMFSLDELKKMIEAAAMFKMNKFHWHLSDDQGFRLKIEKYPLLTGVGARRQGDNFGKILVNNEVYSGYYTKEDAKEIVDFCKKRFIDVIPEIDMPGHTSAILAAYPEYSCTNEHVDVQTSNGIFKNSICPGKEKSICFACDILSEIADVFPYEYIHIGGDETRKSNWEVCPQCKIRMEKENLDNVNQLQSYFTNRLVDFLKTKGKKAIVWNDALNGGRVDNSLSVQLWMDRKGVVAKWGNRGNKVIVSEFFHYYADYPFEMTPLKKTYDYNPSNIKGLDDIGKRYIWGVESPIWTEFINNFNKLCYQCYPRFIAVAESGWTDDFLKNYDDFVSRFTCVKPLLDELGIKSAPSSDWQDTVKNRLGKTIKFALKLKPKKK